MLGFPVYHLKKNFIKFINTDTMWFCAEQFQQNKYQQSSTGQMDHHQTITPVHQDISIKDERTNRH
jgi:hypothetical protein